MALLFAPRLWANSDSISDLIYRFDSYANALDKLSNGKHKLTILGMASEGTQLKNFPNSRYLIVLIFKKNLLGRMKLFMQLIRLISKERVAIAGDPFVSFWILWMMKLFFVRKLQIQISIHGLPLSKSGPRGFSLRLLALRSCSQKADSIRVVSDHLKELLQNSWGISRNKIFIAPIPVRIAPVLHVVPRRKEILIVGRLHEERGVLLSLEIGLRVLVENSDTSLVLIGDGPLKSKVESLVLKSNVGGRVNLIGQLPHSEVLERMAQSLVLLSSAPEEGFGLAIREAAYSGLSVVALRNLGTIEAERELAPILSVFSTPGEAFIACQNGLRNQLSESVVERVRNNANAFNEDSLRKLASSWT